MRTVRNWLFGAVLVAVIVSAASKSFAQADPAWLKSWNESNKRRPAKLLSIGRIADKNEPGTPLVVHGLLVHPDGTPASGVVVHGYHRNNEGFELGPLDRAFSTWELQGWVISDDKGRFEFHTIRPAPDRLGREGPHLHLTLESDRFGRQWAPKVLFSDDRLLTDEQRKRSLEAGDYGTIRDVKTTDGVQHVNVKIRLKDKADF